MKVNYSNIHKLLPDILLTELTLQSGGWKGRSFLGTVVEGIDTLIVGRDS